MIAEAFSGVCGHPSVESVLSGGGVRVAERCTRCLKTIGVRPCKQCSAEMRAPRRTRRYCGPKCKSKAYRVRRAARER